MNSVESNVVERNSRVRDLRKGIMTMTAVIDLIATIAAEEKTDTIVDDIVKDLLLLARVHPEDLIAVTMILTAIMSVVVALVDIDTVVVTTDPAMTVTVDTIEAAGEM